MKKAYVVGDRHDNAKYAKELLEAFEEYQPIGLADALNRNRAYNGQSHTSDGERGKTQIEGLTMRDLRDCLVLAFYDSRPPGCEPPKSVEDLPLDDMSLEAISQNLSCWIERYMGIFPNLPTKIKRCGNCKQWEKICKGNKALTENSVCIGWQPVRGREEQGEG